MSTQSFDNLTANDVAWRHPPDADDWLLATYLVATRAPLDAAAVSVASEQSVCCPPRLLRERVPDPEQWTVRIVSITPCENATRAAPYPAYWIDPDMANRYGRSALTCARLTLAYPPALFDGDLTRLVGVIVGEIHRIGFLEAVRLETVRWPTWLTSQPHPAATRRGLKPLETPPARC